MANTSTRSREGSAKATVADQMSQAIHSTSNLLHLMLQSSPSQAELMKLPRNLLAKTCTIKNTELMLNEMPLIISSLDEHIDSGLQSVPHLRTAMQLLTNMETSHLNSIKAQLSPEAPQPVEKAAETGY